MKTRDSLVLWGAVLIVGLLSFLMNGCKLDIAFAQVFGGLASTLAVIVAVVTLRKMQQSNDFSVVASVHSKLNENDSYLCRRYLHTSFAKDLADVVRAQMDATAVVADQVNMAWAVKNLAEDETGEEKFNTALDAKTSSVPLMSALSAVERVLLDFDLIAVPYCQGNASARAAALAWKPVLANTSRAILPFVAIKAKFRGSRDPYYKHHYLRMLNELRIDMLGVKLPPAP